MADDNVVSLHGGPIEQPETDDSVWVEEFLEDRVPRAAGLLSEMAQAETEAEFCDRVAELKRLINGWPDHP